MPTAVSYRLDERLKAELAHRAAAEGVNETALVSRLLGEGLRMLDHPGVVFRGGPAGRRAGLAGGPDVWEVVVAVRHAPGAGLEERVVEAARQLGVPERLVCVAVAYASAHPGEVEERIAANEEAAERARALVAARDRVLA